ncbi:glycosyltransferase [Sphingobacterium corticis]|uniref:Glycosyltransferase n=1 Tax=Sphingobacterium corticis TaxID=1812823 RepID=A0ABW5NH68_9SPHI
MSRKKLFVIGQVWPEPTSSAAGWRMLQLLKLFVDHDFEVHFGCAATRSPFSHQLDQLGIICQDILLNDASFDVFVKALDPDIVLFDRFMVEEQFGWRVAEQCPEALRVLDTEDLHFLRLARQDANKQGLPWSDDMLYTPTAWRELASIYRCDLSLIISEAECRLLTEQLNVPDSLLYYLPFFANHDSADHLSAFPSFDERQHVAFIGNFLHEPNWKTVQALKNEYWPAIRQQLPHVELHIYGAYASQKVDQLHKPAEGFLIKGRADDAVQTLQQYRLLVAPIPFGAGLKGKFVDAMQSATPSVSSSIGAEAMGAEQWPGAIADDVQKFATAVANLYQNKSNWEAKQSLIHGALHNLLADGNAQQQFLAKVDALKTNLSQHRRRNIFGNILAQEQFAAKKYMSRWIEAKNKGSI